MIDLSNILNTWISRETSSNIALVNHGNSDKYLKHKIALSNDDKITEYLNWTFLLAIIHYYYQKQ